MTAITPLPLLKSQLNLDHDLDDALLAHKLGAAEEWIGAHIGRAFAGIDPVPATLTEAALQLAAHWYEQREAAVFSLSGAMIPFGVHELLASHREALTGHVQSV